MITVTTNVHFSTGKAGRRRMGDKPKAAPATTPEGRIPRISRLMALAIRFDGMLRDKTVSDMSALARLARVTQPRMTQIMNLNHLAPDIQEELLFLAPVMDGRATINERSLRMISSGVSWIGQRSVWTTIRSKFIDALE
jgi:hypothetical protein